jgi:Fe-Mn family superoxide dismutase
MTMATTVSPESTQHARNGAQRAIAFGHVQTIGGLSRIVDRDIEILKMNLVQLHDGRDGARSSAWERLESAWETVRSELADDSASSPLTGDVSPRNSAAVAAAEVDAPMAVVPTVPLALRPLNWVTGVLGPAVSSRTRQVVRWSREPARRVELRTAALKVWSLVSSAALAGAKHASNGWRGLEGLVRRQAESLESTWSRLGSDLVTFAQKYRGKGSTNSAQGDSGEAYGTACEGRAQARLERAKETVKSKLALIDGASRPTLVASTMRRLDEPTTSSPDMPFVLKPLPWFLGALSPVISARTMMMHHGSYYSQCIESANRLSRDHKKLAGKNPLEIVRWAREHARGTELLATASEAWNHSFYWQCLTPAKKRPSGELGKALYGMFGDFSNFADKFALAGATHVGSGWLWLTANSRRQVRILTTSDADCPEARGHTCLLAIDLWEHAYYLDHQNRRREYLDALIDRRLDWEFAEQRFRIVLQRETPARRKTSSRAGDRKRSRHPKQQRKAATSRRPLATTPNSMQRMRFPASPDLRACRRGDVDATDTTKRGRRTEQTRTGGSNTTSGRPRKCAFDTPLSSRGDAST